MPADVSEVPDYASMLRLDGQGIVVAGAGQGIGRQTSHALAACGARILCVDYDGEAAERVAAETGGVAAVADVRERADIDRVLKQARSELGAVAGIVDIVGMARYAPIAKTSDDDYDWTFGMVLRHAWLLVQEGSRAMAEAGGAMTFIASVSGMTGAPLHAAYGAAKAGLMSLVRSAAVELGPAGVRVNAVAPGVVWTPRVGAMIGEEGRQRNAANAPLGRVAETSDIASTVLFLQSGLASYVTGQVLVVDGGVSAKFPYPLGA